MSPSEWLPAPPRVPGVWFRPAPVGVWWRVWRPTARAEHASSRLASPPWVRGGCEKAPGCEEGVGFILKGVGCRVQGRAPHTLHPERPLLIPGVKQRELATEIKDSGPLGSNRLCQVFDLYWRLLESGGLLYTSRPLNKDDLTCREAGHGNHGEMVEMDVVYQHRRLEVISAS